MTTEEKVAKLNELTWHGKGAISLDTKTFTAFIEHPRNYSLIVVLTATDASHACDVCQYAHRDACARARTCRQRANVATACAMRAAQPQVVCPRV